ncbi:MAG: hypothetical protein WCD76_16810 [Pyrinomonadaceae bacterium]
MNSSSNGSKSGDELPVRRVLTVYSNPEEEFVAEYALNAFDLSQFRAWFNEDGDPTMSYCYPVVPKDVEFLTRYVDAGVAFDFNRYCYFVESITDDGGGASSPANLNGHA